MHRPNWIETAHAVERLLPDNFDWRGWCVHVHDKLPVEVYHAWHIHCQPMLFQWAEEALYWKPDEKLTTFSEHYLELTECLGLCGYQRNFFLIRVCGQAKKYTILNNVALGASISNEHMLSIPVLSPEIVSIVRHDFLFGCDANLDYVLHTLSSYVKNPKSTEIACVIPIGYITGQSCDEHVDGVGFEQCCAMAQDLCREALRTIVKMGIYTRNKNPTVRFCEVQLGKKTCIRIQANLPK